MGGHVFLEYMSQNDMFYESIFLKGGHVEGNVLLMVTYWWSVYLQDGRFYNMLYFTGRHVLLEDMFYLRVCIIGGHVLQFKMSYWSTCFTGGHLLQDDLS